MLYKSDWEKTQKRYLEFWNRENHDRPLISITAPKDGHKASRIKKPERLEDIWTDMEYVIKSTREKFASTFFGGESYPELYPNLGPDILGATLGCELEFGEDTSWAHPVIHEWKDAPQLKFDPENKWWKKIRSMTEEAVKDAGGDYLVGITDLHPGADGVVSLRGPERTCLDLFDHPDEVKKAVFDILDVFKEQVSSLYEITSKNQEGSTNWMGIWHPGKWYVTSCDFICMISTEMFSEFVLPELLQEIEWLDATIFHLDGPGALKHLDALLEIPGLDGIQWVYGAGQPTASHWIPVLKKIQKAGKLIQVYIEPNDLDALLENLEPEGVMYVASVKTEQDAKDILKKAETAYRKKLF